MNAFLHALHGEWTKFRSVRSTAVCLVAAVAVTVLLELLGSTAGSTDANKEPQFTDQAYVVYKPLSGDGTIIARVVSQRNSGEWAKAGLLVKSGITPGSPYAALMVTTSHGVRMQANFNTDISGPAVTMPRWLKLTRAGNVITGYESPDGRTWQSVGSVTVTLPRDAEVGMFVGSPPQQTTTRTGGGTAMTMRLTVGSAVFDSVAVTGTQPAGDWTGQSITTVPSKMNPALGAGDGMTRSGGTFTISGEGDIAGYGIASWHSPGDDDVVMLSLFGVRLGMIAVIALGVLFMTAEYRTGLIRTTLAAGPRRGHVLAAKAVVIAGTVFVTGLVASVANLWHPGSRYRFTGHF